jgi:hypothetical protein
MTQTAVSPAPNTSSHPPWQQVWGHFQHELLYLSWALMEVVLLTPFLMSLIRWVRLWPPGLLLMWLLLLMLLPFNLARLMGVLRLARSRQRWILALALLLTYLFSLRALFYQPAGLFDLRWLGQFFSSLGELDNLQWLRDLGWFFLTLFIWWRGLRLAGKEFTIAGAGLRLRVGGLILAPLVIWWGYGRLPWSVTPFILLFFLVGLTAAALTRAEEVERAQSGRSVSLNPRWLLSVLFAAFLIISAAALLTTFASGQSMFALAGWLAPLWAALYAGSVVVLSTILYLTAPLIYLLGLLAQLIAGLLVPLMSNFAEVTPPPTPAPFILTPEATRAANPVVVSEGGVKSIVILFMIALILAVTLALGRLYRQAEMAAREGEPGSAGKPAPSAKRGFGQRLLDRLGLLRGWRTAVSIRRIYRNMSRAAAVNGYPRAQAETPYEYLPTLARAWPENGADTRLITEAYIKIRYGELPESREELAEIRAAWKRLEAIRPIEPGQTAPPPLTLDKRIHRKEDSRL